MTDSDLVLAALAGRADAYGELMDRHQVAVARVCRGLIGPGPDSDEMAHDALVDGYLKLGQLRDPERFGAWIRTIALNRCRRWLREHARLSPLTERMVDELAAPVSVESRSDGVAAAVFRLAPAQRLMLILHYWERLPYADIAEFLGVPIGTVMSRLSRARAGLRKVMEMHTDDMAAASVPDVRREVDAEIRVMLALVEKDRDLRGRLAVLLRKSPRRLEDLVAGCNDESARDVALLLPRLGSDVMDRILGWVWGCEGELRTGAVRVARALAGVPAHVAERAPTSRLASRGLYALVDRTLEIGPSAEAPAELLLDLLDHTGTDERAALLLANAAVACGAAGLEAALARLRDLPDAASVFRAGDALYVACRYGTRFGEAIVPSLEGAGPLVAGAAAACAEAMSRAMRLWVDLGCLPDDALRADGRHRRKWAVPLSRDREPAVIDRLAEALQRFAAGDDPDLRQRAIRALGMLPCDRGLDALMRAAQHPDERTALVGIRALGDRADMAAGDLLADLSDAGSKPIRVAAVQALGALCDGSRLPLLERLGRVDDKELRRAASTAARRIEFSGAQPVRRGVGGEFHMADVVRDGATPAKFISLEAAVAAIPEDRQYDEPEITRIIATASWDYSSVRRYLVEEGLLERSAGQYRLTDFGRTAWRVERRIAGA